MAQRKCLQSNYNDEKALILAHGGIIPPSAVELEGAVLGALLVESHQLTDVALVLRPDDFYEPQNAAIFAEILSMGDANRQIDLYTVATSPRIKEAKITAAYLAELTQKIGSAVHVVDHARIIKQKSIARRLMAAGLAMVAKANDEALDVEEMLTSAAQDVDGICEMAVSGKGSRSISEITKEAISEAERRCALASEGRPTGITTGLHDLDKITGGGWQASQLVVLAGRPSMGKTAVMLHVAKSAAKQGTPVCIYSLEMSDISLANRLLLSECEIDSYDFRTGRLSAAQWRELENAQAAISKLPIYVDDQSVVSMRYIKAHSTIMAKKGRCGMIMCDYLQLAEMDDEKKDTRERDVAKAMKTAKGTAKDLKIPFIMLSQLNRGVESRADKKPVMSDLRESGSIEQDADIVALLFRPAYYGIKDIPIEPQGSIDATGIGIISIAKQRDGAVGDVVFRHNIEMNKIWDYQQGTKIEPAEEFDGPF